MALPTKARKLRRTLDSLGNPKRICIYCRVSSDEQKQTENILAQVNLLRRMAEAQTGDDVPELDRVILVEVVTDDGVSGTLPLDERPGGQRLIQFVRDGLVDEVWIYALDRLARKLELLIDIEAFLSEHGVALMSKRDGVNTQTHTGKLVFHVLGAIAEWEKDNIIERLSLGRNQKAEQGKWTGGPVPFGYETDDAGKLVESSRWVEQVCMTEADLVRAIFTAAVKNQTPANIARWLSHVGVPSTKRYQKGKKTRGDAAVKELRSTWSSERIRDMIHSTTYRGEHRLNTAMGLVVRPTPALVTEHQWRQANLQTLKSGRPSRGRVVAGLVVA